MQRGQRQINDQIHQQNDWFKYRYYLRFIVANRYKTESLSFEENTVNVVKEFELLNSTMDIKFDKKMSIERLAIMIDMRYSLGCAIIFACSKNIGCVPVTYRLAQVGSCDTFILLVVLQLRPKNR